MKIFCSLLLVLFIVPASPARAQDEEEQPPFIFTVFGGLFLPSNIHFREMYDANSELIYGFGATFPLGGTLFLASDVAFLKADAYLDPSRDSSAELEQRFIHLGVLSKQPV